MTTTIEVLAEGYELVEAPRVDGEGRVYFSDVLGGGVYRWTPGGADVDVIVPKRRGVGGMALHADGGVIVSGRDLTHVTEDATNRLVFAPPFWCKGFNDICALPTGAVVAGGMGFMPFSGEEPVEGHFVHVDEEHDCIFVGEVAWPNGCNVSPDGRTFYACDYHRGEVRLRDETGERLFTRTPNGEADGLAVDDEGGVWVALGGGEALARFRPDDGELDRTIDLPGRFVTSLAFGGDTLFVTTARTDRHPGALLRMDAPVPGQPHLLATI